MKLLFRVLTGLIGILSVQGASHHWLVVETLGAERGMQAIGAIGRANIRADVGGIFLAIGLFALIAAWKQSAHWTLAAMLLVGSTLLGRLISAAIDGLGPREVPPIAIEAAVLAIFTITWLLFRKTPEGL